MNCVVVGELSEWKEGTPIRLLVVDVTTKVLFEDRVDSLSLAVGPGVERSRQVLLDVEGLEYCLGELGREGDTSIGDDIIRETMGREDFFEEELDGALCIHGVYGRGKMRHLGEPIDKDANCGVPVGCWKLSDKVDRDRRPWSVGNRQGLQETVRFVVT